MADDRNPPTDAQVRLNKRLFAMLVQDFGKDPETKRVKALERLISRGADVTSTNANGDTPLHVASGLHDRQDSVTLLLKKGAEINAKCNGWTPLHNACARSNAATVKVLLENEADVSIRTPDGETPLHIAIDHPPIVGRDARDTVTTLLANKRIDLDAKDKNGRTAADLARHRGEKKIAEAIEDEIRKRKEQEKLQSLIGHGMPDLAKASQVFLSGCLDSVPLTSVVTPQGGPVHRRQPTKDRT